MNKHSLSELPDKEFLDHANSIYDNCSQHSMTWNMDSSQMEEFNTFLTIANNAYKANSDPSSRNSITSMEKKRAFADLKHRLSIFVNYIESNLNVPDEALAYMKLRPRVQTGRQPIPAPTEAPIVEVRQQHDEVTVYVTRKEYGQPTDGVQLKPYHGFKLRWKFEDEEDMHIELFTRLHYTIYLERKDETRRIILAVAWVNPRLQEGPWSEDMTVIII
ncbi:MAG: hypothetical protein LBK65_00800 [Tannerellaceae bacterium]|jgi:hypothetical protein|nr:hypothetical protein [Tannerellaceae bacterium]